MTIRNLVPALRGKAQSPATRHEGGGLLSFQDEMNRLFDDFFGGFGLAPARSLETQLERFSPRLDISENEREIRVTAELPGMDEKDIQVTLDGNVLTISGEKKEEREDKGRHTYRLERSYGTFRRSIPLSAEVNENKVKATFKKGVLSLALPKVEDARAGRKRIPITEG